MDPKQDEPQIDQLNYQRRQDMSQLADIEERLKDIAASNLQLEAKFKQLEIEIAQVRSLAHKVGDLREILDRQRADFTHSLDAFQVQNATSERETEHLRQLEREAVRRSLSELQTHVDTLPQIQQELLARREDAERLTSALTEIRNSIETLTRTHDQGDKITGLIQDQRRQDLRRIAELSTDAQAVRRIQEDVKAKINALEELGLRSEARISDLTDKESDREASQKTWIERQERIRVEHDRILQQLESHTDEIKMVADKIPRQVETYAEEHSEMLNNLSTFRDKLDQSERMIEETKESQSRTHDQLRDESEYLRAELDNRWVEHTMQSEKQWKQHEQEHSTIDKRLVSVQSVVADSKDKLTQAQATSRSRLKEIAQKIQEFIDESEKPVEESE